MQKYRIPVSTVKTLQNLLEVLEAKAERGGVPPKGAQSAARRGLELRREFGRGGTMVGVARARDIQNGKFLPERTVRRMKAYFDRHEVDKQGKDWDNKERPSNGKIAWLLWGGDAGRTWATTLVERWNREDGKTKSIPRWLPNGEEITELSQLAAVLCIDEKTAAFVVLDSHEPPKALYEKAVVEVKGRSVRDSEYWGAPVGTPLPLPSGYRKPSKPSAPSVKPTPSTSTTKPKKETNRARAEALKDRADTLRSDGKPTRAAVYSLRSHQARTGIRSYRKSERTTVSLPVKGRTKVVAKYAPSTATNRILKSGDIDSPTMYELDPSEAPFFHAAISKSKESNAHGASVYVYDVDEYRDMRLFVTADGGAGFALKGGDELVSVFKGDTDAKRVAHPMVHLAIEEGARRGDAFDTVLPHIYGDHGLATVGRVKWNDEYSPEGWDKDLFRDFNDGEPDVIFMAYMPDDTLGYAPGIGQTFDDYDAAYDYAKEQTAGDLLKAAMESGRVEPSSKDVFGADRTSGTPSGVTGAVAAPFETLKPVRRRKRVRVSRIINDRMVPHSRRRNSEG